MLVTVESRHALATRIVLLWLCFMAAMAFAALIPLLWHDKLYIDGLTIVRAQPTMQPFGSSFAASAFLLDPLLSFLTALGLRLDHYGLLYDADLLIVNGVFGALFFVGIALFAVRWRMRLDIRNVFVFSVFVVLFAPFFFCITKEVVLFALTVITLCSYRSGLLGWRAMIVFYIIMLALCGIYFRVYYLAYAGLLLFNLALWRRRKWLLIGYLLAASMLVVLHDRLPLDLLNKGRATYLENVSASRIEYYFDDGSGVGFLANRAVTLGMLLLPVNLLGVSLTYAPFIAIQIYLTCKMIEEFIRPQWGIKALAACAVLAFTVVAALFEPDFGSYFRHKVGILLFMLLLVVDVEWRKPMVRT